MIIIVWNIINKVIRIVIWVVVGMIVVDGDDVGVWVGVIYRCVITFVVVYIIIVGAGIEI